MRETMKTALLRTVDENHDAVEPEVVFQKIKAKDKGAFTDAVDELKSEGKLVITKKGKIQSVKASGMKPAKIVSQSKHFCFARPLDGGEDVYIPQEKARGAMLGDIVFLNSLKDTGKGPEAAVDRILVKGSRVITGTVLRQRKVCELVPDSAFRFHISIERGGTLGARDGDKVQAVLSKSPRHRELMARVLKIYGKADSAKVCADAIIDANGIPREFPAEVMEEAKRIQRRKITKAEIEKRLDLRKELIFTIDGADAKDLDDAVSVKKIKDGWKLSVHIADVSHYVKAGSELDKEALRRGTSVYFADRVIPMLPKELSNGVCSLNAGEDKLTFSAIMKLDEKGALKSYEFHKSVINSKVRGVYSEVNEILAGKAGKKLKEKYKPVLTSLKEAKKLAEVLMRREKQRGSMELESGEVRFVLDQSGVCVDVLPRVQGEAEKIIEQFMITANVAAALTARRAEIPFVYRVHESPDPERLQTLSTLAGALGLPNRKIREGVRPRDLSELMKEAADTPYAKMMSHQILRTMAKARYDNRPLGHFGLGLSDYCHFTSPIRRYPDTAIHRILSELKTGKTPAGLQRKFTEYASNAASLSSKYEVRAMTAEREAEKCYMAEYMTAHLGETHNGIISGATARGVFVALANGVEGFVSLEHFPNCRFQFDGLTKHTDIVTGDTLQIGEPLKIEVMSADVATGRIDFLPAE